MSGIRKAVVPNSLTQGWDGVGGGAGQHLLPSLGLSPAGELGRYQGSFFFGRG